MPRIAASVPSVLIDRVDPHVDDENTVDHAESEAGKECERNRSADRQTPGGQAEREHAGGEARMLPTERSKCPAISAIVIPTATMPITALESRMLSTS